MRKLFYLLLILCAVIGVDLAAANSFFNDDLLSVSFPDGRYGWAAGRWGAIICTKDGGQSWSRQHSGTDNTLTSIFFVDTKTGWAVGENGIILHTQDGGGAWQRQESPVPCYLMGAYFINPLKGWIVGEQTHILYTSDGGATWSVQFSDEDFILKSISFADDRHGWTVGEFGFTYHTRNGGRTWQLQAGSFGFSEETGEMIGGDYLFDVEAVSPLEAWAVGIEGRIMFTTDGGATWSSPAGERQKEHLLGITTAGNGIIVATGKATMVISVDSGRSWQQPEMNPPITYGWLYDVAPRGDKGFVAVGKEGWIYRGETAAGAWSVVDR